MLKVFVITALIVAIPVLLLGLSELMGLFGCVPVLVGVCVLLLFVVLPPQIALCTVLMTGCIAWVVRHLMNECADYAEGDLK